MPDLVLDSVFLIDQVQTLYGHVHKHGHAQDSFHDVGKHFKGDNLLKC